MPQKPNASDQAILAPARIPTLDRARTFITLLVLLHHSVVNYTYFGSGDPMRWLGFDLIVLFNDSFFMACMFLISGLFVRDSLARKGPAIFLRDRAWRLGVPYLLSVFVVMPIAYYPTFLRYHLPGTTDFNFLHFWWHTLTIGPWPSGPAWFLWVLLALDAIAAIVWSLAPRVIETLGRIIVAAARAADDGLCGVSDGLDRESICRCTWHSATQAGWSRTGSRCRSRPAVSCFTPAISSPASVSARPA